MVGAGLLRADTDCMLQALHMRVHVREVQCSPCRLKINRYIIRIRSRTSEEFDSAIVLMVRGHVAGESLLAEARGGGYSGLEHSDRPS